MAIKYNAVKSDLPLGLLPKVDKPMPLNVGIAIPAKDEEKNLEYVLSELKNVGFKNVLVIDGLSSDGTVKVAARNGAKIVLQDGRGKGAAVRQVLNGDYLDVDVLVLMDADGSMSPLEVPRFVKAISNGADIAKGSRFIADGGSNDLTLLRRIGNKFFTTCVNMIWSAKFTDLCYGFVALSRRAVQKLAPVLKANDFEIETELFIKAQKLGLKIVEVPSFEHRRRSGRSNLHTFRDGLKILRTILLEAIRK